MPCLKSVMMNVIKSTFDPFFFVYSFIFPFIIYGSYSFFNLYCFQHLHNFFILAFNWGHLALHLALHFSNLVFHFLVLAFDWSHSHILSFEVSSNFCNSNSDFSQNSHGNIIFLIFFLNFFGKNQMVVGKIIPFQTNNTSRLRIRPTCSA